MTEQHTTAETRQALRHALYHATPGQWAAEVSRWEEDGRQYSYTTGITPILKGMTWQGREHEPAANVDAIVGLHNAASDLLDDADALAGALAEVERLRGALFAITKAEDLDEAVMVASAALTPTDATKDGAMPL